MSASTGRGNYGYAWNYNQIPYDMRNRNTASIPTTAIITATDYLYQVDPTTMDLARWSARSCAKRNSFECNQPLKGRPDAGAALFASARDAAEHISQIGTLSWKPLDQHALVEAVGALVVGRDAPAPSMP